MTKHYKIHIVINNAILKVSYRNGKFFKMEKLTGKLTDSQVKYIGLLIPPTEAKMDVFKTEFKEKATYTLIEKSKSIYAEFLDAWFSFYDRFMGVKPRFNGTDGKHLKQIIAYLKTLESTDEGALQLWKIILQNWDKLDDYYKKSADLKFINSQINKILINVKKTNNSSKGAVSDDYLTRIMRDLQS